MGGPARAKGVGVAGPSDRSPVPFSVSRIVRRSERGPRDRPSNSARVTFNYLGPLPLLGGRVVTVNSEAEPTLRLRRATVADATAMAAIYNDAVATTIATFDTQPRSAADQLRWLEQHAAPFVALVADVGGEVVGWASLSPWSERRAYAQTGEVSVYVEAQHRGSGVGRALVERLVEEGGRAGFHTLLARIADPNPASFHLHTSLGFRSIGVMREVGLKFGRRIDVHLLQRMYPESGPPGPASGVEARTVRQS